MILIISDAKDVLAKAVFSKIKGLGREAVNLQYDSLLKYTNIADYLEQNKENVCWTMKDGAIIASTNIRGFLNRCPALSIRLFKDFVDGDQEYALMEYQAYLFYALSKFKGAINPVSPPSLNGLHLSFPEQFNVAAKAGFRTPNYIITQRKDLFLEFRNSYAGNLIVRENAYQYRHYQRTPSADINKLLRSKTFMTIALERPLGTPVLCHIIDNKCFMSNALNSKQPVVISTEIRDALVRLSKLLKLRFSEVLLFQQDSHDVVFGYISPWPELGHMGPAQEQVISALAEALGGAANVH